MFEGLDDNGYTVITLAVTQSRTVLQPKRRIMEFLRKLLLHHRSLSPPRYLNQGSLLEWNHFKHITKAQLVASLLIIAVLLQFFYPFFHLFIWQSFIDQTKIVHCISAVCFPTQIESHPGCTSPDQRAATHLETHCHQI